MPPQILRSYLDQSGNLAGLAYDTILSLSKKLNIKIKIDQRLRWKDIYRAALDKKIDVIATVVNRPERQLHFDFTQPYIFKSLVIVTHKSDEQTKTLADLSAKKVFPVKNYQYSQGVLDSLHNITPLYVNSIEDALFAV